MPAQMEVDGFRPLEVELAARVAYSEAALAGKTPGWYQPNGAAAADIVQFAKEADDLLSENGL
ncbi:hypothetical protein [Endothiovibrio diazotrophicus]